VDIQNSGNQLRKDFIFKEEHIVIPMIIVLNNKVVVSLQDEITVASLQGTYTVYPEVDHTDEIEPKNSQPEVLRRSTRERRSVIANDYIVYLQEHEFDIRLEDDPTSLNEAKLNIHSTMWSNAMKDELKFMKDNDVWDLVELPKEKKPIG